MSELTISSTNWLAVSLRNGAAIVFNLNDPEQWQYLKPVSTTDPSKETTTSTGAISKQQTEEDDENANDLNRDLIKFSPNGQKLAINGHNKQIYIYIPSDYEKTTFYWELQRTILIKKRASAIDLTDEVLLIADKSGDVYKTDLSSTNTNLTLTSDDCIMGHLSMLLDIAFIRTNTNQEFILTTDRDEKIRLSYYPNAYNIQGYCLGHTEFVSRVKLIDNNRILSASGDGTLRLWQLPDCEQLNSFHSQIFTSSSKDIFYKSSTNSENKQTTIDSSPINSSIWKMDITSNTSDVFIALSIYADRSHSIYLTTLSNLQKSSNEQRKLTFDSNYGTVMDYCFPSNSDCYLYILFDSNTLVKVNVMSILSCDKTEYFEENDQTINRILGRKEFTLMNYVTSNDNIFKQLFKTCGDPADSSYYKRKNVRLEQQEEKKKRKQVSTQFQEKVSIDGNV